MPAKEATDRGVVGSARNHVAVTPSNTDELGAITRALWVGVPGDLTVTLADSANKETYKNAQGWMPLQVRQVWLDGTTASGIIADW